MSDDSRSWNRIVFFLVLTAAISSVFYGFIIQAGRVSAGGGAYVTALMWSPGIAGLIARYKYDGSLQDLGWMWGRSQYQITSYLTPIAYAASAYAVIWLTGLGGFYDERFLVAQSAEFGWTGWPRSLQLAAFVVLTGTVGMVAASATALGEELGWRGFLVPELLKVTGFTSTAFISGMVWAAWHYPILLFADYNSGSTLWVALLCFTIMVVGMSVVMNWFRVQSGSLWTAVLLHASHNVWVQNIFGPLTTDTGPTEYVSGEFGAGLALAAVLAGYLFWRKRPQPHALAYHA